MGEEPQAKDWQGAPRTVRRRQGRGPGRRPGTPGARAAGRWPLLAGIVLLAALLPTWRAVGYDLVWDDKALIGPKLDVRGLEDIPRIWNTPFDSFLGDPMQHPNYFRPVALLTLALDRSVGGDRPAVYHRTNLLWYALACLFLWLFAWEMSRSPLAATAGAVVFALHPAHAESVCFVSGRTDLLAGAFLFASLWAAARWGPRLRVPFVRLVPASALLLPALFSKEVAFMASPILVLALWTRDRAIRPRDLALAAIPVALADLVYLASRFAVVGANPLPAIAPVQGTASQLLTSVAVVARYVPLLLFPFKLSARHEVAALRSPDAVFFLGAVALAITAVAVAMLLRRRSRWAIPVMLVATTLLPLCSMRLIAGALVAERFVFIPSAALALAVAFLPARISYFTAGTVAPFFLALLLPRVAVWKDDAALYASMLRDSPNSPHVHSMAGGYYYHQGDLRRAIEHHRRAFELMPEYTESLLDLSAAEDESGQTDSALAHVHLLLRLRPEYPAAWYALGNYQVRVDQPDSAAQAYTEAIRLNPNFAQAENNLGVVLERMGRVEDAITHYKRAEAVLPGYPDAVGNLARLAAARAPGGGSASGAATGSGAPGGAK